MKKKNIYIVLIVVVLFFSLKKTIYLFLDNKKINKESKIIKATIINYSEIGISNYYLKYEYRLNGRLYRNEVIPKIIFHNCQHDSNCIGKHLYIKYSVKNPSISVPIYDSLPSN